MNMAASSGRAIAVFSLVPRGWRVLADITSKTDQLVTYEAVSE